MSGEVQLLIQVPHEIAQNWGWFFAFGIALIILGVAAVVRSVTATTVSMLFFGSLLVLACLVEIAQAVMVGHWAGFFQHLVAAILFGVAGILVVTRPTPSAEVLTLFMAFFFLVGGIARILIAVSLTLPGWGWQIADGVISMALGVLVIAGWPISGLWAIGLFLGIELIVEGCMWIGVANDFRSM